MKTKGCSSCKEKNYNSNFGEIALAIYLAGTIILGNIVIIKYIINLIK